MANVCQNYVTLTHDDPAVIARAMEDYKQGNFLQELGPFSPCDTVSVSDDGKTIILEFDTAWKPPIEAYRELERSRGFSVYADYCELANAFCGVYESKKAPVEFDIWNDAIPDNLNQRYGIGDYTGRNSEGGEDSAVSQGEKG